MLNRISGKIQHYAWGGYDYLPTLLHIKNNNHQPFAEYWLGAHPKAPSEVHLNENDSCSLDKLIAGNPAVYLGKNTAERFGRLPYLFKVLDVKDMLSIQVHPSKEEAEKGFARENETGILLDAHNRNYKDDNHKPEMMVALSTFYLLHGFLKEKALKRQLEQTAELSALLPVFQKGGNKMLYEKVMTMPQEEVNHLLSPLLDRVEPLYKQNKLEKTEADFWAARTLASGMTSRENIDRGIFSIYFFNILCLQKGEGIFQAAGLPHAYLEGQNIELMANSDNVLRGGLTSKHVDVSELLQHLDFGGIEPHIIRPESGHNKRAFPCSVPDFALEQFSLKAGDESHFTTSSLEILLLISGEAAFSGSAVLKLDGGESLMITAGEEVKVKAYTDTLIFKAGAPV